MAYEAYPWISYIHIETNDFGVPIGMFAIGYGDNPRCEEIAEIPMTPERFVDPPRRSHRRKQSRPRKLPNPENVS